MPMTSKEMVRLLLKNGYIEITGEGKGSHRKFQNPVTKKTLTVPYHNKDLGKGIEAKILKQAGLKK